MPTIPLPQVSAGCLAPLPRSAGAGENVGKARPAGGTPLGDKKSNPRRRRRPHNHRHPARSEAPPEAFERRSDLGNEWPACRLDAVPAVPVSQPAPRGRAVGRTVGVAARCLTAKLKVPPRGWPYRERTGAAAGVIRLGADGIEDTASSSAATAAGARLSAGQPRMDGTRTSARHPRSILLDRATRPRRTRMPRAVSRPRERGAVSDARRPGGIEARDQGRCPRPPAVRLGSRSAGGCGRDPGAHCQEAARGARFGLELPSQPLPPPEVMWFAGRGLPGGCRLPRRRSRRGCSGSRAGSRRFRNPSLSFAPPRPISVAFQICCCLACCP